MRYTLVDGVAHLVTEHGEIPFKVSDVGDLKPRNEEQRMAMHAALNAENAVLVLEGEPGTGKTAIATVCFLHRALKHKRMRVAYTRLNVPMGQSLGHLPGTLDEKQEPWIQSFFDQVKLLPSVRDEQQLRKLVDEGKIFFPAIPFIKGRTFDDTLLIVDEAQDLPVEIAEAILARMGRNSVVAFLGDRNQIDTKGLTPEHNGLVHVARLALTEPDVTYVRLVTPERGRGAELAIKLRRMRLAEEASGRGTKGTG